MGATKIRHLRIPDGLWQAATEAADAEHTTVTALVVRALIRELKRQRREGR